jgi:hypothetical protein
MLKTSVIVDSNDKVKEVSSLSFSFYERGITTIELVPAIIGPNIMA